MLSRYKKIEEDSRFSVAEDRGQMLRYYDTFLHIQCGKYWWNGVGVHKPYYDNQREWKRVSTLASTSTAIKNPFSFYYINDNGWTTNHKWDFWNINFTNAASVNNTATIKTIYDPSITGFTLPKTAAFTGFTSTGGDTNNSSQYNVNGSYSKGWNFLTGVNNSTIFFESLGIRNVYTGRPKSDGYIISVTERGFYWTSGSYSINFARYLDFANDHITIIQAFDNCSAACSVRSVKE